MTKELADYSAITHHLQQNSLYFYTFLPKSEKPIMAVIRHLPGDTLAEDISNELVALGFSVVSFRQMKANRQLLQGGTQIVNLPRSEEPKEMFKLNNLSNIIMKVEACRAQTGLTQCYNCQKFGHVWANCKQPPRCLWRGGGHLKKECPEKTNENSTPNCCNCTLTDGEKPHLSIYRGCSHAKDEMQRRKKFKATEQGPFGRTFFSKYTPPDKSFATALTGYAQSQQQPQVLQAQRPKPDTVERKGSSYAAAQASCVKSSSLDDMFRVASVVQQIMTQLNGAVSEEEKIVARTKIVLNLMNGDGH
jgi:hypothetical protein